MRGKKLKSTRVTLNTTSRSQRLIALVVAVLVALGGAYTLLFSHAATPTTHIYISPSSQSVTTGSNVVISVIVDPGGAAINTVQSVLSYSPSNFSFVGITAGPAFTPPDGSWQGIFTYTTSSGSVQFTASPPVQTTTTNPVVPITSVQTVVTITLHATGTGTSAINFASICPAGNFALTCSAAYDNVTNTNDLIGVATPIIGGSYTVTPILPTTPTALHSTATTTTSASLAWTGSTDTGGPGLAGYHVFRDGSTTPIASTTGTTYTDTGLAAGSSHSYTVAAYDTATPANSSGNSNTVNVTTIGLPTKPTLSSTGATANSIALSWTASTDTGGPGLAGYHVFRDGTLIASPTGTTYNDTGLTASTSHSYTVTAFDTATPANSSATSNSLSVSTKALPVTPTGLHSTATTTSSISLAWTASTDTGGPGLTGYHLYRNGTLIASPTGTTYTDSGLASGTSYAYTIAAYDTDGNASPTTTTAVNISTTSVPGDLDGDSHVTGHDLSILLSKYGTSYTLGEFDGGSIVEGHDLSILLSNYGR